MKEQCLRVPLWQGQWQGQAGPSLLHGAVQPGPGGNARGTVWWRMNGLQVCKRIDFRAERKLRTFQNWRMSLWCNLPLVLSLLHVCISKRWPDCSPAPAQCQGRGNDPHLQVWPLALHSLPFPPLPVGNGNTLLPLRAGGDRGVSSIHRVNK